MNKYLKILSLSLALTSSVYLPSVNATSSTDMLITIAETNPALIERLNVTALNDIALLNQLLEMADSNHVQLERLLNLAETNPETFSLLVTISNAEETDEEGEVSTMGIGGGGIIRN